MQLSYKTTEHKAYLRSMSILKAYTLFTQLASDGYKTKKKKNQKRNLKRENFSYIYMHYGN